MKIKVEIEAEVPGGKFCNPPGKNKHCAHLSRRTWTESGYYCSLFGYSIFSDFVSVSKREKCDPCLEACADG